MHTEYPWRASHKVPSQKWLEPEQHCKYTLMENIYIVWTLRYNQINLSLVCVVWENNICKILQNSSWSTINSQSYNITGIAQALTQEDFVDINDQLWLTFERAYTPKNTHARKLSLCGKHQKAIPPSNTKSTSKGTDKPVALPIVSQ